MNKRVNLYNELKKTKTRAGKVEVPKAVRRFLGDLSMLEGVPPYYLVPDEKLLPKEMIKVKNTDEKEEEVEQGSIRFFFVDPFWVQCLLNGALQIADFPKAEVLLTRAMAGFYLAEVVQENLIKKLVKLAATEERTESYNNALKDMLAENINKYLDKKKEQKKELAARQKKQEAAQEKWQKAGKEGEPPPDHSEVEDFQNPATSIDLDKIPPAFPSIAQNSWRYTGFLFRSTLISAWKDLKVEARGKVVPAEKDLRFLRPLRQERLGEDTLLFICEGFVSEIVIEQPPETLHFGVDVEKGKFKKAGNDVPWRNQSKRVLNLKKLAAGNDAAQFAQMMIAQPLKNTITVDLFKP